MSEQEDPEPERVYEQPKVNKVMKSQDEIPDLDPVF